MDRLVNLRAAASTLCISTETLRKWAAARRIASIKLGRRLLFSEDALRDWVVRHTRPERREEG